MLTRHAGKKRWSIAVTLVTAATFVAIALRFGIGPQLPASCRLGMPGFRSSAGRCSLGGP